MINYLCFVVIGPSYFVIYIALFCINCYVCVCAVADDCHSNFQDHKSYKVPAYITSLCCRIYTSFFGFKFDISLG